MGKINLRKEYLLVLFSPLFFLFNGELSYLFLIISSFVSVYYYLKNEKAVFYTLLLTNTYHLYGESIYKSNFLFVSIVYLLIFIIFIIEFKKIRKIPPLMVPFLIFFPIRLGLGLYFNFSIKSVIVESVLFSSLFLFTLIFYNKAKDRIAFLRSLKNFVLYYFPYLTLSSLLKGEMIDLKPYYLDEFSHFYLISIFPIIFFSKTRNLNKFFLITFHLMFIFIRVKYLYISSFAFIGAGMAILLIIGVNFIRIYKYLLVVIALSISFVLILEQASVFGKHKIDQIDNTLIVLRNISKISDLKKIPNSPKTRILEVLNINQELYQAGMITVLFGKGFGSYFTDNGYSFKEFGVRVDESAFSEKELSSNKFLRPHNTIPYVFLKLGYLGLFLVFSVVTFAIMRLPKNDWLLYSFVPYFLILFGAGLKNFIIIGVLLGIIFSYSKNKIV